jgi:arylformamidase
VSAVWQDISAVLAPELPIWPGSPGVLTTSRMSIAAGADANVSQLEMDVHTGTHVDAPHHFVDGAAVVEDLGLDPFIGRAVVADCGGAVEITAAVLDGLELPDRAERLLLCTVNSAKADLYRSPFDPGYAALTLDGAEWLAARGDVRLIGIDYLSVQRHELTTDIHRVILGAGIAILEGLDLHATAPGEYELICLPLRLAGVEASPARAILRSIGRI